MWCFPVVYLSHDLHARENYQSETGNIVKGQSFIVICRWLNVNFARIDLKLESRKLSSLVQMGSQEKCSSVKALCSRKWPCKGWKLPAPKVLFLKLLVFVHLVITLAYNVINLYWCTIQVGSLLKTFKRKLKICLQNVDTVKCTVAV